MTGTLVRAYAGELRGHLAQLGVDTGPLDELVDAAEALAVAVDEAPETLTAEAWQQVTARWAQAVDAISEHLVDVLLGALAELPGLAELAADATAVSRAGIHGEVDVGPVHLAVASSTLVIQPPTLIGGVVPDPIAVGPFQVGQIAASLASPFGGGKGLPGGGSIVRLPGDGGYGGTLELPLGPVQVSAAAVLAMLGGQPSFLAILGATFLPPIQLSFGFSLDRVGGVIGVNRRADTDALTAAVRSGTGGDVIFSRPGPLHHLSL